jgi:hypothetical protein
MQSHEIVGQVRKGTRPPEDIGANAPARPAPRAQSRKPAARDAQAAAPPRKAPRFGCGF